MKCIGKEDRMYARASRLTLAAALGLTLALGAVARADDMDVVPR